jgi:hypothetical protein
MLETANLILAKFCLRHYDKYLGKVYLRNHADMRNPGCELLLQ